jgi:uncharacterized membrane protein YeiB
LDAQLTTGRLVIPDVLRGIAILSMLIAHAKPLLPSLPSGFPLLIGSANDVASPLFALVMGMSAEIVTQRTPRPSRGWMLLQQAARGVLLIALGVWMATWGSWVSIVLAQLGLVLLVGAPILLLSTRWVIGFTVGVALISDPINAWARQSLPGVVSGSPVPALLADWAFLNSSYRLTNLLPFFLLGAVLMRHGFRRDRLLWTMAIIAPIAYAVRPVVTAVFDTPPHTSGSYVDTLHDVGLVFAVYVVTVVLATVERPRPARVIAVVFEPLRAIGSVALSLYLLHVALIAFWASTSGMVVFENDYVRWLLLVPGMVAVGWLWWRYVGVGPVEWLLGWVTGRPKRWRRTEQTVQP